MQTCVISSTWKAWRVFSIIWEISCKTNSITLAEFFFFPLNLIMVVLYCSFSSNADKHINQSINYVYNIVLF
uniref:Putative ovule protein n=1 Tax=Solanum chacoense TaxID=4108 RepID=A0A0V0GZF3_SOLCH